MFRTLTLTLIILTFLTGAALAAPGFDGPTGLFTVPTAEVVGTGDFSFGVNYRDINDGIVAGVINYGAVNRLEAGIAFFDPENGESSTWVNAKYLLLGASSVTPAVALGVKNLTSARDVNAEFYAVATQPIALAKATLTAGLALSGSDSRLIAGATVPVFPRIQAVVEQNEDINLGLRFQAPLIPLNIDLAVFDLLDDKDLGVSAGYTLRF
ncbi:MAG: hypothetical protein PHX89_01710 [bacterium]|jgi:hypothetical protein|nr:hypothetical protein [bacterium]MDD3805711.1 hypothetical protein [bacterium]MDD4557644.1 hypothetical protein [bacterium]